MKLKLICPELNKAIGDSRLCPCHLSLWWMHLYAHVVFEICKQTWR